MVSFILAKYTVIGVIWYLNMTERNFLPKNRKSIESSNDLAFGAYKDDAGNWKSTGDVSQHIIEFDESEGVLNFRSYDATNIDENVGKRVSFFIRGDAFAEPNRGFLNHERIITDHHTVSADENNSLFIGRGSDPRLKLTPGTDKPRGFYFYAMNESSSNFIIEPVGSAIIYGLSILGGSTFRKWTDSTLRKPAVFKYSTVMFIKLDSVAWVGCYWQLDDVIP